MTSKKEEITVLEIPGGPIDTKHLGEDSKDFVRYVCSNYSLIWIKTSEYVRCITNLMTYTNIKFPDDPVIKKFLVWDGQAGVRDASLITEFKRPEGDQENTLNSTEAIYELEKTDGNAIMFALDFHKYIKDVDVFRTLLNAYHSFKTETKIFCVISPILDLPEEIARYFSIIDYKLAEKQELENFIKSVTKDIDYENDKPVSGKQLSELVSQSQGLTTVEIAKALQLSYSSTQSFSPKILKKTREQIIKQNPSLQIIDWENDDTDLKGMVVMKEFVTKMIERGKGKGILIVGPPGSGKTQFAKHIGKYFERLTIGLDLGKLKGELVGQTERMTGQALDTIDSVGQCILLIDEIEKGLSGMNSSKSDGGTSQNQGARLLKWLNDKLAGVCYVIATANNISEIPAEFLRSGRFDSIFYVGLPTESVRKDILDFYMTQYKLDKKQKVPNIVDWTGAEIKSLCNIAEGMGVDLITASKYVNPICKVSKETLLALKEWARGRTINAEEISLEEIVDEKTDTKTVNIKI